MVHQKFLHKLVLEFLILTFVFLILPAITEAQWAPPDPCWPFECINDCEAPWCQAPPAACFETVTYECGDDTCTAAPTGAGTTCCENGQCWSCPEPEPPFECGECNSCGDSSYRWCTGGSYGSGECVNFTCECRPDLCGGDPGGPGGPPPPLSPSVDLMGPATIEVPNSVILSWNSSNADSCSASGDWSGGKAASGSETLTLPRGTYAFTLNCSGPGGSASDSVTVQIIQVPQCTFWADPSSIVIPQSSALRWTCQYADSCSINQGVGAVCASETECSADLTNVRPKQITAYILTCNGLDGSRSYNATVNVGFIPKLKEVIPQLNWLYSNLAI